MEQFSGLKVFIAVADAGGFSSAGYKLGVSTSLVSRQIAALEAELGVRLLKRTTRRLELTEAGSDYLGRIRSLLTDLQDANVALRNPNTAVSGRFRLAVPSSIGMSLIAPALADFMANHPGVTPHVDLLDRQVDASEEDYDLVFRMSEDAEPDNGLLRVEAGLCASPAYCAIHNRPHGPSDLDRHWGLFLVSESQWHLRGGSNVRPLTRATCNRLEVLKSYCLGGQGIALLPSFLTRAELDRGDLVQVLDGFEPMPRHLTYGRSPQRRESVVVKQFVSFLETRFRRMRF